MSTFSNGIRCQNSSCESRRPGYTSETPRTMVNRGSLSIIVSCSSAGGIRITLGLTDYYTKQIQMCKKNLKMHKLSKSLLVSPWGAVESQASTHQELNIFSPQSAVQFHPCTLCPHVRPILTVKLHKTSSLFWLSHPHKISIRPRFFGSCQPRQMTNKRLLNRHVAARRPES